MLLGWPLYVYFSFSKKRNRKSGPRSYRKPFASPAARMPHGRTDERSEIMVPPLALICHATALPVYSAQIVSTTRLGPLQKARAALVSAAAVPISEGRIWCRG